jgi:hypothetical protein
MHNLSTLLPVAALLDLPLEAQHTIIRHHDLRLRRALVTSPYASIKVIEALVDDSDRDTHHVALRRTTNVELIRDRFARSRTCCLTAIARNPNTPTELLDFALNSSIASIRLAAYVNTATPVTSRRALTPQQVTKLVDVGEPIGSTVVRSHEALIANPHLFEDYDQFGQILRRAAFAMPHLTLEQHQALRKIGSSRYANRHPVFTFGSDWVGSAGMLDLLALKSPAADLWLAENPSSDAKIASDLLLRKDHHVEPHVIARLLSRFGTSIIPTNKSSHIAQTRVDSSAWSNPYAMMYNEVVNAKNARLYDFLLEGVQTLEGESDRWETFLTLAADWEGPITELFASARSL